MKPSVLHCLLAALLLLLAGATAQAQPDSGGPGPGTNPTETPLDGGASLLLAAGAAYGLRRLRKRRTGQAGIKG